MDLKLFCHILFLILNKNWPSFQSNEFKYLLHGTSFLFIVSLAIINNDIGISSIVWYNNNIICKSYVTVDAIYLIKHYIFLVFLYFDLFYCFCFKALTHKEYFNNYIIINDFPLGKYLLFAARAIKFCAGMNSKLSSSVL